MGITVVAAARAIKPLRMSVPIEAIWQRVIGWGRRTKVFALFDKDELVDIFGGNGGKELTVVGKLESGRYLYGRDTVRIIRTRRQRGRLRRRG